MEAPLMKKRTFGMTKLMTNMTNMILSKVAVQIEIKEVDITLYMEKTNGLY